MTITEPLGIIGGCSVRARRGRFRGGDSAPRQARVNSESYSKRESLRKEFAAAPAAESFSGRDEEAESQAEL